MPLLRIHLDTDRGTARRVLQLHQEGRAHHESLEAAREQVWRQGHTPSGDPVFVGVTNGRRDVQLLYDVDVYSDATG
ncbi:hypothetical protein MED01_000542 [Micromonospora sp. MED01]|uniref:hypothetical protein n=1 Tax=Micromonospora alfalfae TaxID=2911212 RepID=UPI001EE85649|nr:hypothetical protein [Micromonospora alfalfae]MCG5462440.1 hypothetical protein [Micromonospora alfalfae]